MQIYANFYDDILTWMKYVGLSFIASTNKSNWR